MATNILGKVSVVLKGDYAAASQYKQLDIVKYNGGTYICVEDCTGVTPGTNESKWMLVASGGSYTLSLTNDGCGIKLSESGGSVSEVVFEKAEDRVW